MSNDDVNRLTPDDGDLDEAVVARLRSALLDDVAVNDTERDHTIASVLAALDNESQAPVVSIESRRRFRSNTILQFAAAVLTVAIGAGALFQLRGGQSDTAEVSVQESSRERSEENVPSESEVFAFAEESALEESAVEAAPEVESMGDTALGSDLSSTEDEMVAVAESATEEMAGDIYELESISVDELPNFIRNALEQGATTLPSAAFCEFDKVELLTEVMLDEIIVVLARMTGLNQYLAIDVATCEVLAETDLGNE